jgi:serine/threonine-protein kinase
LKKDHYPASNNLGIALAIKGRANEAIVCFKEAIRLQKDNPEAHGNLGNVLKDTGRLDEAIAEYREALRLKKDEPRAQQNLAITLQWKVIADKLPRILKGDVQPADAAERIALAAFCQQPFKGLNRAAFRFYSEAFAEQPQLTDDLNNQHRYNAACAAALAGCGQGQDAGKLEMNERAHLRTQAMDWLEADLKAYRQLLAKPADKAGPAVAQRLQHWRQDADFTGVRGDGLKQLPEAERQRWQVLWTEVESLRRRAAGLADPAPDTPELVPPPKELP